MKFFLKQNSLLILFFLILLLVSAYNIIKWNLPVYENDPIILFYNVLANNLFLIELLAPIFVIIPSIYNFHRKLHTGCIKNYLMRTSYKKYMLSNYISSILKSLILPVFIVILMIMCCIKLNSVSFGSGVEKYNYFLSPDAKYAAIIYRFMLVYLIGMILNSIFYTNLGLIYCKKNSNFFVSVILSFLTFIGIDIFTECFIGGILLARILDIHQMQDTLNLFSIWTYNGVKSLSFCLIYYLLLTSISTFMVYLTYRNKEMVLYETEK